MLGLSDKISYHVLNSCEFHHDQKGMFPFEKEKRTRFRWYLPFKIASTHSQDISQGITGLFIYFFASKIFFKVPDFLPFIELFSVNVCAFRKKQNTRSGGELLSKNIFASDSRKNERTLRFCSISEPPGLVHN